MGGNSIDEECEFDSSSNEVRTVVLVGRTGNGKSATGNSIVGKNVFRSRSSSSGVTSFCEMQTTMLNNGQIVNVIDTPGLFDNFVGSEFLGKEIVKCLDLAKDGIHAIIVVFSVRARFTDEEVTAIQSLQTLFGSKIVDYMIVVFTGGDELEDNDQTLEDYLGSECPEPLKKGVFQSQLADLKGRSKEEISEMKMQMQLEHEEQLKQIVEKVETKLNEATRRLEKQLAKEQAARLKAEENAKKSQKKLDDEKRKLRNDLERARAELHNRGGGNGCAIL